MLANSFAAIRPWEVGSDVGSQSVGANHASEFIRCYSPV